MRNKISQINTSRSPECDTITEPVKAPSQSIPFLTPDEVATKLRVTPEQVRSLIRKGMLRAVNVGAGGKRPLYRIPHEALQSFVSRGCSSLDPISKRRTRQFTPVPDFFPDLE